MRKLLISTVGGMLALGALWAPLAQGAPVPGDPCDILSNIPSGYASCKADEARDPGFRQRMQQQQQGEVGKCADETEAQTQQCLQQQQVAAPNPPQQQPQDCNSAIVNAACIVGNGIGVPLPPVCSQSLCSPPPPRPGPCENNEVPGCEGTIGVRG